MVKNLDSNLFLGDEIKEVYTEIMKTVPRDHLNCEQVKKKLFPRRESWRFYKIIRSSNPTS